MAARHFDRHVLTHELELCYSALLDLIHALLENLQKLLRNFSRETGAEEKDSN